MKNKKPESIYYDPEVNISVLKLEKAKFLWAEITVSKYHFYF